MGPFAVLLTLPLQRSPFGRATQSLLIVGARFAGCGGQAPITWMVS